jgi:hypothetical protein
MTTRQITLEISERVLLAKKTDEASFARELRMLAVCPPDGCVTVADLVRRMAPQGYGGSTSSPRIWTEDEVWSRLQGIIANTLQVDPAPVTKNADIVRDLGAG